MISRYEVALAVTVVTCLTIIGLFIGYVLIPFAMKWLQ